MAKISVLTPSYNSGKYLKRAIDSVLIQEYVDFEHIVIDGASTDNTVEILKSYPHIIWKSEEDSGQSDAMNKAFKMSSGDIIVYLNADDYFLPGAFQTIGDFFKENNQTDIVVGNLYIERNGEMQPNTNATINYNDLRRIKGRFPLNPVSYFYKRKVQQTIGPFPEDEHYTMDFWFLIRAFFFHKIVKIEEFLGVFTFSGENKTANHDSFNAQRAIALKFVLSNDIKNFGSSAKALFLHQRSKSKIKYVMIFLDSLILRFKRKIINILR